MADSILEQFVVNKKWMEVTENHKHLTIHTRLKRMCLQAGKIVCILKPPSDHLSGAPTSWRFFFKKKEGTIVPELGPLVGPLYYILPFRQVPTSMTLSMTEDLAGRRDHKAGASNISALHRHSKHYLSEWNLPYLITETLRCYTVSQILVTLPASTLKRAWNGLGWRNIFLLALSMEYSFNRID